MSTLADELLADFDDSGSEGGENDQHDDQNDGGLFPEPASSQTIGAADNGMELDGDEEEIDEEMEGMQVKDEVEDESETKIKVDKMQLGDVNDVRSVARLMKTLEPILKVSTPSNPCFQNSTAAPRYTT